MTLYRSIPVEVEAWQWTGDAARSTPPEWLKTAHGHGKVQFTNWRDQNHVTVYTDSGAQKANPGDWIIRGRSGELSVIEGAAFPLYYEKVAA